MIQAAFSSILRQKKTVLVLSLLLLAVLLSIVQYMVTLDAQTRYANQYSTVSTQVSELRNRIEYEINTSLNLTLGVLVYVSSNPDISQEEFSRLAQPVRERAPYIRNFALARNNVISHIYPIEGNRNALGFDYMANPEQRKAVLRAINDKQTVIAGPVNLVQGGQGFISRVPIFLSGQDERYWGMTSLVVMVDAFLDNIGLTSLAEGLDISLRGKDGLGAKGAVFYGDGALFDNEANVVATIRLPNGSWRISAAPKGGWNADKAPMIQRYLAGMVLSLLISVLVYFLLVKNIDLELAEKRAIEAGEHKNRFFTQMTHELRTPMTAIHGSIRLLESGTVAPDSDKAKELLRNAERNSQRLIWLINDILDMKKLESGKLEYHKLDADLQEILQETIVEVEHYANQFDIVIHYRDKPDSPVGVCVDRIRIQQVVANLLTNAIKFSPQGGEVTVSLALRDGLAYVEVSDQGPGLDETMKDDLFGEFSQADNTHNATRKIVASSGLGLSISKQLIEGHDGRIGFYNRKEGGATFFFEIPLARY